MRDIEKIAIDFVRELAKTAPDDYLEIKLCLLAVNHNKPRLESYLKECFKVAEQYHPLLIEMKGGAV